MSPKYDRWNEGVYPVESQDPSEWGIRQRDYIEIEILKALVSNPEINVDSTDLPTTTIEIAKNYMDQKDIIRDLEKAIKPE